MWFEFATALLLTSFLVELVIVPFVLVGTNASLQWGILTVTSLLVLAHHPVLVAHKQREPTMRVRARLLMVLVVIAAGLFNLNLLMVWSSEQPGPATWLVESRPNRHHNASTWTASVRIRHKELDCPCPEPVWIGGTEPFPLQGSCGSYNSSSLAAGYHHKFHCEAIRCGLYQMQYTCLPVLLQAVKARVERPVRHRSNRRIVLWRFILPLLAMISLWWKSLVMVNYVSRSLGSSSSDDLEQQEPVLLYGSNACTTIGGPAAGAATASGTTS